MIRRARASHDEAGTTTLFVLGLAVCVLVLGGLVVDLWRVIELRRALAATADAAASAGANGLDEAALRRGDTTLDPGRAERFAAAQLELEPGRTRATAVRIDADTTAVRVELVGEVELGLLGIVAQAEPIEVHAVATAEPRRSP